MLKNKVYRHLAAVSKNICIDKLDRRDRIKLDWWV